MEETKRLIGSIRNSGLLTVLNAANVALVAFARARGMVDGQVAAFLIIAIAAAEAAIGLMIVIHLQKSHGTLNLDEIRELRG